MTFAFGALGTAAELLLMEHTEGLWQILPLILLGIGCPAAALVASGVTAVRPVFKALMLVFAISGIAGSVLHYNGNVEFERELDPELAGVALFREAMQGATPALAPGTMMLLGAVGWAYARVSERA
jgi:hypothetical protein